MRSAWMAVGVLSLGLGSALDQSLTSSNYPQHSGACYSDSVSGN
jgi:hypothetical protein